MANGKSLGFQSAFLSLYFSSWTFLRDPNQLFRAGHITARYPGHAWEASLSKASKRLSVLRIYNTFVHPLQILCDLSADQLAVSHRLIVFMDNIKLLNLLLTSNRQWIVCQYVAHIKQKRKTINNRLLLSLLPLLLN